MIIRNWLGAIMWVVLCVITGAVAGWLSRDAVAHWYPSLRKPELNPPDWVFAPVWTTLYVVMGIAIWMVWTSAPFSLTRIAVLLFVLQLALNFFWSILFFLWRRP